MLVSGRKESLEKYEGTYFIQIELGLELRITKLCKNWINNIFENMDFYYIWLTSSYTFYIYLYL